MTCPDCTTSATNPVHGVYDLECVMCCARLVVSARPHKRAQESMLETIRRVKGSPSRQAIMDCIKLNFSAAQQKPIR